MKASLRRARDLETGLEEVTPLTRSQVDVKRLNRTSGRSKSGRVLLQVLTSATLRSRLSRPQSFRHHRVRSGCSAMNVGFNTKGPPYLSCRTAPLGCGRSSSCLGREGFSRVFGTIRSGLPALSALTGIRLRSSSTNLFIESYRK